jgi:hypothetical protein
MQEEILKEKILKEEIESHLTIIHGPLWETDWRSAGSPINANPGVGSGQFANPGTH